MRHGAILREIFLNENSIGNITRLLKISNGWARYFQEIGGADSFRLANWMVAGFPQGALSAEPPADQDKLEFLQNWIQRRDRPVFAIIRRPFDRSDRRNPLQRATDMIKGSAQLRQVLSRPFPDLMTLQQSVERAYHDSVINVDVSHMGEELLKLSNGFVWKVVSCDEFRKLGPHMMSCGIATDETMLALFDPNGRVHVVASWNDRANTLDQISGKANSHPGPKYMPMIDALVSHLGATLENGEDSFLGSPRE